MNNKYIEIGIENIYMTHNFASEESVLPWLNKSDD